MHAGVANYYGGANKNMGGAFLLAWKICDGKLPGLRDPRDADQSESKEDAGGSIAAQRARINCEATGAGKVVRKVSPEEMVDSALAAFVKVRVDVNNANQDGSLGEYLHHPKMRQLFGPDFQVVMGFGLHIGWAIEGAIGSKYKMDVSYLSPNVNMSARLEAATHQFSTAMLISEWVVGELSQQARDLCRLVDRVTVVGSQIPMKLYTFDIFTFPRYIFEPQFNKSGEQERVTWDDSSVQGLRAGVDPSFFSTFDEAVQEYMGGRWDKARTLLDQCRAMKDNDGPTESLTKVMAALQWTAPADWKGYRALTNK